MWFPNSNKYFQRARRKYFIYKAIRYDKVLMEIKMIVHISKMSGEQSQGNRPKAGQKDKELNNKRRARRDIENMP